MEAKLELKASLMRQAIRQGRTVGLRIRGNSMYPTLKDGSMVLVEPLGERELQRGDIVVWHRQDGGTAMIVHRVLRCYHFEGRRYLVTKGDHVLTTDLPIQESDVIGAVCKQDFVGLRKVADRLVIWFNLVVYPMLKPVIGMYLRLRSTRSRRGVSRLLLR